MVIDNLSHYTPSITASIVCCITAIHILEWTTRVELAYTEFAIRSLTIRVTSTYHLINVLVRQRRISPYQLRGDFLLSTFIPATSFVYATLYVTTLSNISRSRCFASLFKGWLLLFLPFN